MRLFIAINFDGQTKEKILAVQDRLREQGQGKFTRRENLHLTLAFLGEVPPGRVEAIHRAMDHTAISPLSLTFDHTGRFRQEGGDLWWLGLGENEALMALQQELAGHLSTEGFPLESRPFAPHITLARQVRLTASAHPDQLLGEPFSTQIHAISLMHSQQIGGRLTYTELHRRG